MEVRAPFVRCRLCDAFISILDDADGNREDAPESFVARCPGCNAQALYAKSDIRPIEERVAF